MDAAPFELQTVVHLVHPWGRRALDLDQLRDGIAASPAGVLFHHTVQFQLRHPGADELPPDDFSAWIGGVVQDAETAERMTFAVQGRDQSADSVRAAMLEVLDRLPAARRRSRDAPEESAFEFLGDTSVVFPTGVLVHDGRELVDALMAVDAGTWFYHLTEEPWSRDGRAAVLEWLETVPDPRLARWLAAARGAGQPIEKARGQLLRHWRRGAIAKRVSDAAATPEDVRREAGRQTVARFVRRVTRGSEPS